MKSKPFQFELWNVLVVIAICALILGAGVGDLARKIVIVAMALIVVASPFLIVIGVYCFARTTTFILISIPARVRRWVFSRRWDRLRPGQSTTRVQSLLGKPSRVEGFGDREYWSYLVAGQRFTLSLSPRHLLETYTNGLTRDRVVHD